MFGISQNSRVIIALLRRVLLNQEFISRQTQQIIYQNEELQMANEEIQQEVNDLREATQLISQGVGTLNTNLITATNKIAELEAAGVHPDTLASLRSAVDGAQEIAKQFAKAADPEQPTPDASELPQPVETVADEEVPAGGETATGDDSTDTPAPETETPASDDDTTAGDADNS
ncbi:hypothetical protein SEA_SCHOMBER_124 [Gordonia Phage Schomber]|uniref:Uncharacterized protein n=1 Tax=Gordonia phage Chidiebere TaxID=2656530 RepID=A0A649VM43_9CAUD|nr:hypothetical protein PQD14_gp126 [Gordonia phage Chidiebere]AZS07971.1 hypothetical protein PBI_GRAY_122 [Gordonia phage Gray]QGJ93012.1 hypothetical protein PBI_CHIDIEBERE_126 [Gordonia phage Chidiebere]WAA20101.1 hypothetical protein SEA_HANEM_124 [Gordonia phage Hanem]WNM67145.1 hypothetical protein SEA_SCHOMBER_124 [Gordonia Phage Schomber]